VRPLCPRPCRWWPELFNHPQLSPRRSPHMSVMRVIALSPCTKSEVRPTPLRKIWRIFRLSINRPGDLDLWPFDLLMGSPITCVMGFLPAKFQLATPFHSGLRVRHGQTDRRSDRRRPSTLNASHCGGRSIKYDNVRLVNLCIIIIIIIINVRAKTEVQPS